MNILHENIDFHSKRVISEFPVDGVNVFPSSNIIVQTFLHVTKRKRVFDLYFWNYTASKRVFFYVPHKRKILSSYDVIFDESFSSALAYTL